MNTSEHFWIFSHTGLGDHIVCNSLYRHYAEAHKDKVVVVPLWERNLAAVQWMLSDVPNIFFYPIETEQQLLTCQDSMDQGNNLALGFYKDRSDTIDCMVNNYEAMKRFNPIKWDSEFYRQAGLYPELKWSGFKLPVKNINLPEGEPCIHHDTERGFIIRTDLLPNQFWALDKTKTLDESAQTIYRSKEIHCIDSSMLNLADLMETPYCKRFVFHRYARKGLPPQLRKQWEIID